ncbi:START domain-containing protein [Pseudofulvibacter geojedonensis]|uniref:START domain-containing protein n=1 Tax=Pseudofulvibacter geojedonensis TaxID=1123758 RepID=A0ABW3I6A1_9FLAO
MRFFYCFILVFSFQFLTAQGEWELSKNKEGIKIYVKERKGYAVKEYRAEMILKSSLDQLLKTILNGDKLHNWTYKTDSSKLLKKESDSVFYVYMYNDFPWPVKNRDHISKLTVTHPSSTSVKVSIESAPAYIPKKSGVVRVEDFSGFWLFEEVEGGVKVTQQLYGDPAGYLPDFIANSMLVKAPYNTFLNLKKYLDKKSVMY